MHNPVTIGSELSSNNYNTLKIQFELALDSLRQKKLEEAEKIFKQINSKIDSIQQTRSSTSNIFSTFIFFNPSFMLDNADLPSEGKVFRIKKPM